MTSCLACSSASESGIVVCEICYKKSIHIESLGVIPKDATTGALAWRFADCANFSIIDLLAKIISKLDAIDQLTADVSNIQKTWAENNPQFV